MTISFNLKGNRISLNNGDRPLRFSADVPKDPEDPELAQIETFKIEGYGSSDGGRVERNYESGYGDGHKDIVKDEIHENIYVGYKKKRKVGSIEFEGI